ncbi:MAG: response regulator transcription factor [Bacteroidota bacterium]|nr:response regulator transcription factor [Bacteroidota bacterium]
MPTIRIVLIDDERSAREEMKRMLQDYPDLAIVGEAANAAEARKAISDLHPDLLFLDIQMPGESGFELLESLDSVPEIIFVTAFDQYALKAFEVSAIDYLMKPVRDERLAKAIEQFRRKQVSKPDPQVFIKDGNSYHLVRWSDVFLIESLDNYARLWFNDKKVLMKTSLNQLETKLDPNLFFRANRAQIIQLRFIEKINQIKGQMQVLLKNKTSVDVSIRQAAKLKERTLHIH